LITSFKLNRDLQYEPSFPSYLLLQSEDSTDELQLRHSVNVSH